jgi:peptidoglycan/xylan/chitin deacetylase (PgdA/CDA1 family)
MILRAALGTVRRRVLCTLHRRPVLLGERGPIVSFAFDDFPRTAYTTGGSILKSFGVRGTYYAAIGLMNTSNDLGEQFQADDLYSLVSNGHELAGHTFSHIRSSSIPLCAFQLDVKKGQQAIRQITGIAPSGNFAYPYGDVTLAAKKALGEEMTSCRGIFGGINAPDLDLNLLRANSLYGDVDQLTHVEKLISENKAKRGWLIFYTHDVRDNPSRYGCTPALLVSALSAAMRSGSEISTVARLVGELQAAAPPREITEAQQFSGFFYRKIANRRATRVASEAAPSHRSEDDSRGVAIDSLGLGHRGYSGGQEHRDLPCSPGTLGATD